MVEGKHQHHVNELRCWKRADYQAMSQYFLDVDWLRLMSENLTPDTLWSAFCEVLNNAIEQFVPIQHVRNTHCSVIKHYPHNIKSAIARKRCLWRQLRNDRHNNVLRHTYKQAGAKCRLLIYKYELKKERKIVQDNNTGSFYKFINEKLSCKRGVGALCDNTGSPG